MLLEKQHQQACSMGGYHKPSICKHYGAYKSAASLYLGMQGSEVNKPSICKHYGAYKSAASLYIGMQGSEVNGQVHKQHQSSDSGKRRERFRLSHMPKYTQLSSLDPNTALKCPFLTRA